MDRLVHGYWMGLVLLDEVTDWNPKRGAEFEQSGDGGHHPGALDLVDRRRRYVADGSQLLKRQTLTLTEVGHLGANLVDDCVDLNGRRGKFALDLV